MTAWNWPLLALDSSGPVASVVLATSPGQWHARQTPAGQAQASQLLPMAEAVLQEAGLRWADLGGLVVCHGPGSFTGLRMAVGLAQGLGFSRGLKIHLVSAFEAVAMAALASSNGSHAQQRDQLFDIRFDARLGEAFRGVVHWRAHLQQLSLVGDPRVVPALEEGLSGATLLAQDSHPTGMTLAAQVMKVAELRLVAGPPDHPATVMPVAAQPLYVRDRVAQTLAERAVSASLVLLPMHRNDIASIMVIEKQAYSHPWTSGNFEDSLAAGYEGLKLVEQGAMVGYLVWMPVVQEAHLLNFTIAPARQRRGLGQWMLDQLMRTLTQQGFERLLLEVRPSNRSAVRLYQRNGFTEVGTRRGYYPAESGRREDAVVFARSLAEVSTA